MKNLPISEDCQQAPTPQANTKCHISYIFHTPLSRYKMKNDRSQLKKRMVYIYIDIDTSGPESGTVGSNINIE